MMGNAGFTSSTVVHGFGLSSPQPAALNTGAKLQIAEGLYDQNRAPLKGSIRVTTGIL